MYVKYTPYKHIMMMVWFNLAATYDFSLGEKYRPVRLRRVVLGYNWSEQSSDFKFDISLNYKIASIIHTYSENKPTLVVRLGFTAANQIAISGSLCVSYNYNRFLA